MKPNPSGVHMSSRLQPCYLLPIRASHLELTPVFHLNPLISCSPCCCLLKPVTEVTNNLLILLNLGSLIILYHTLSLGIKWLVPETPVAAELHSCTFVLNFSDCLSSSPFRLLLFFYPSNQSLLGISALSLLLSCCCTLLSPCLPSAYLWYPHVCLYPDLIIESHIYTST